MDFQGPTPADYDNLRSLNFAFLELVQQELAVIRDAGRGRRQWREDRELHAALSGWRVSGAESIRAFLEFPLEPFPVSKGAPNRPEGLEDVFDRARDVDRRGLVRVARRDGHFFDAEVQEHGANEKL